MGNHSGGFFCKYVKKHRKRARESTADAGNMLNGKAVVDEPTVTEFTEIESMDEIIKLPAVYRHYKKYNWVRNLTELN